MQVGRLGKIGMISEKVSFRNFLETFTHNPQYVVTLEDPDDDDEDDLCTLIVSLMQKGRRGLKHEGAGMLSIGNPDCLLGGKPINNQNRFCDLQTETP